MDITPYLRQAASVFADAWAGLTAQPMLAGALLAVGGLLALVLLALAARLAAGLARGARSQADAARIRRMGDQGARIVLAEGLRPARRKATKFVAEAVRSRIGDYMFGGPFVVSATGVSIRDEAHARKFLTASNADLLIWTVRSRGAQGEVRVISRAEGGSASPRPASTFRLPRQRVNLTEALGRAVVYGAAKHHRPALGRPQDFRAERLKPVVQSLVDILADRPVGDPALMLEMNDDLAAGALQLALAGEQEWIERCVDIARAGVAEISRSAAPDRWAAAKINLGRALRLSCDRRFDPVVLQEAITHLTEALDALRAEPRFKLAEAAAQSIADAQRMLANRRRFSISAGGI